MRTSHVTATAAVAVVCGTVMIGCSKRYEPEPRMTPASGTTSPQPGSDLYAPSSSMQDDSNDDTTSCTTDQAIDALTEARCAHHSRCGRISSDRQFAAWAECVSDERGRARSNMKGCSARISTVTLEACLNDIRTQDCDAMPDSLDRVPSCTGTRLCGSSAESGSAPWGARSR